MDKINQLINETSDLTGNQIIDAITSIGNKGDVILIKNDGLRQSDNFTVVISSAKGYFESIRYDSSNLSSAVKKALDQYRRVISI